MPGNRLQGHLPPQLSFLSFLEIFSAGNNRLEGGNIIKGSSSELHTIDVAFAGVSTLQALTLHGNAFTGRLPSQVFRDNSQLQVLLLGENQFQGTLPSELAAMTNIWELGLSSNNLTGSIPTSLANLNQTLRKLLVSLSLRSWSVTHVP
jgi:Leucine rich repeat